MALARGGQTLLSAAARQALGDALARRRESRATATTGSRASTSRSRSSSSASRRAAASRRRPTPTRPTASCAPGDLWRPVREDPPHPAGRARRLRRPRRRAARARAHVSTPARGWSPCSARAAPARRASPSLWPELARRLAGRRLVLRPVRGAHARRHPLRRRARRWTCRSAGTTRRSSSGTRSPAAAAAWSSSTTSSRSSQHAAATARPLARPRPEARFVVTSRERLHLRGRGGAAARAAAADGDGDRAVRGARPRAAARTSCSTTPTAPRSPRSCACSTACRWRSSSPRRASRVLSPAQILERLRDRFRLLAGRARRRRAPGDAARARSTGRGSCSRRGSRRRSRSARCSRAASRSRRPKRCSTWRLARGAAGVDVVQALVDKSLLRMLGAGGAGALRDRRAVLRHVPEHPGVRGREARAGGPTARRAAEERHGRYFAGFGTDEAIEALSAHGGVGGAARSRSSSTTWSPPAGAPLRAATATAAADLPRGVGGVWSCRGRCPLGRSGAGVDCLGLATRRARGRGATGLGRRLAHRPGDAEARARSSTASTSHRELGDARRGGHHRSATSGPADHEAAWRRRASTLPSRPSPSTASREPPTEGRVSSNLGILHHPTGPAARRRGTRTRGRPRHPPRGRHAVREGIVLGSLGLHATRAGWRQRTCYDAAPRHPPRGRRPPRRGPRPGQPGQPARDQGRMEEARALRAALAIHREVGDRRFEGNRPRQPGPMHVLRGRYAEAREHYEGALAIAREDRQPAPPELPRREPGNTQARTRRVAGRAPRLRSGACDLA